MITSQNILKHIYKAWINYQLNIITFFFLNIPCQIMNMYYMSGNYANLNFNLLQIHALSGKMLVGPSLLSV